MDIEKTKNYYYIKYSNVEKIFCPYLETDVVFNSNGFRHIIYSSDNKKRPVNSSLMRFKLLESAVNLLETTTTVQEFFEHEIEIKSKTHNKPSIVKKNITYWGFIGIINHKWKVKAVVKKVGNGKPFFWSVIPNWVTSKKRDEKFKILHVGDIEND
ncbi:MAG: hypothetical protein WCO33_01370 [bacterium]